MLLLMRVEENQEEEDRLLLYLKMLELHVVEGPPQLVV